MIDYGDADALQAALDTGADPDTADRWGVTALAHAAARGDLPVLGFFFRSTAERDVNRELLFFVTPKILKETLSLR